MCCCVEIDACRAALRVLPNRSQFFQYESVTLSCGPLGGSAGWRVKRNTSTNINEPCGRTNTTPCVISELYPFDTGVYWCESAAGECSNAVNITVIGGHSGSPEPPEPPESLFTRVLLPVVGLALVVLVSVVLLCLWGRRKDMGDSGETFYSTLQPVKNQTGSIDGLSPGGSQSVSGSGSSGVWY
ncbi:hypothetical protein FQN60_013298 [Etheostoma spectabile]|uniref:Ig-like domain-containing protein n=1 Tax=Etheostoma spectabile TaxID=54343 RepID=A0A5J5DA43_9PERO|nr:hypothetical protein FQN60_013298 [Etheostoma spectabile]